MKVAYKEEASTMQAKLEAARLELETFYAKRYEEGDIKDGIKEEYERVMTQGDAAISSCVGTIRSIRNAIASWFGII